MQSEPTEAFWNYYRALPHSARLAAARAYRTWRVNPRYPGLHFKKLDGFDNLYSVRVGIHYRALGVLVGDTMYWQWIGHHRVYDRMLDA